MKMRKGIVKFSCLTLMLGMLFVLAAPASVFADDEILPESEHVQVTESETENVPPDEQDPFNADGLSTEMEAASKNETDSTAEESSPPLVSGETIDHAEDEVESVEIASDDHEDFFLANVIAEVPQDTGIVILDEEGEQLPLACEEAVRAFAESDPIWCPVGIMPGGAGCTAAVSTITDLLPFLSDVSGAGTIYFTANYGTEDVYLDNSASGNMPNLTSLILQGGWNGSTSSPSISGVTTFTVPIEINWNGDLTLTDIKVDTGGEYGNILITQNSAESQMVLDNVTSTNGAEGAFVLVEPTIGGSLTIQNSNFSGNTNLNFGTRNVEIVTINNSSFNTSSGYCEEYEDDECEYWGGGVGLKIEGVKDVSLSSVEVNGNMDVGILIEQLIGDVNFSDIVAQNNGSGISVYYGEPSEYHPTTVVLDDIDVSNNEGYGVRVVGLYAYNAGYIFYTSVTASGITADSNAGGGMMFQYLAKLDLSHSQANDGWDSGLYLSDIEQTDILQVQTKRNGYGVYMQGKMGSITLSEIDASHNSKWHGLCAWIDGDTTFSISDSVFNNNGGDDYGEGSGIYIQGDGESDSSVSIQDVTTNGNYDSGISISNVTGTVSIQCATSTANDAYGINVATDGAITLTGSQLVNGNNSGELNLVSGSNDITYLEGCGSSTCRPVIRASSTTPPQATGGLTVNVSGGEAVNLSCNVPWTSLQLPKRDKATFTGLCGSGLKANLKEVGQGELPGALPAGMIFGKSLATAIVGLGSELPAGSQTIIFTVPEELQGSDLTILFWDVEAGAWVEIAPDSVVFNADGSVSVTFNFTGTFVLAGG